MASPSWKATHWVSYFYTMFMFMYILRKGYELTPYWLKNLLSLFGKASYEIFLSQMFIISVVAEHINKMFSVRGSILIAYLLFIWLLSIGGGLLFYKIKNYGK